MGMQTIAVVGKPGADPVRQQATGLLLEGLGFVVRFVVPGPPDDMVELAGVEPIEPAGTKKGVAVFVVA